MKEMCVLFRSLLLLIETEFYILEFDEWLIQRIVLQVFDEMD